MQFAFFSQQDHKCISLKASCPWNCCNFLSQSFHPNQIWELEVSHGKMHVSSVANASWQTIIFLLLVYSTLSILYNWICIIWYLFMSWSNFSWKSCVSWRKKASKDWTYSDWPLNAGYTFSKQDWKSLNVNTTIYIYTFILY